MDERFIVSDKRCILVDVQLFEDRGISLLHELRELALSAGLETVDELVAKRSAPDPKLYLGSGKSEELASLVKMHGVSLVVIDQSLSPAQTRNLEKCIECRVLDRTGLILDIFSQRASSFEGKLQVELAQLHYLSTRLVRGWSHLERQKGGIGLRGPGETQLEVDRRLIRDRIKMIDKKLTKVCAQRDQARRSRRRSSLPTVSLVGYTNAGKSTLFNTLTGGDTYVEDQLFATLDPKLKRFLVPKVGGVVLVDTVGFIRQLPHDLVQAFRATLEETVEADLLLHVVDVSDPAHLDYIEQVDQVLHEIHAVKNPLIWVYNKSDCLDDPIARIDRNENGSVKRVWISATTGQGIDLLMQALTEELSKALFHGKVLLKPTDAPLRSQLYELECIVNETVNDQGYWCVEISISQHVLETLCRDHQRNLDQLVVNDQYGDK